MRRFLFPAIFFSLLLSCDMPPGETAFAETGDTVAVPADSAPPAFATHEPDSLNSFLGKESFAEKTSFVTGIPDTFATIEALLAALKSDQHMHEHTDARFRDKPRTAEESRNVCLEGVYIFAVKREDDNDFHVVLGSTNALDGQQLFFTAEIAGLPDSSSPYFEKLSEARNAFKAHFGEAAKKEKVFLASKKHPPIFVKHVTGTLFFDNHHYGGSYGMGIFRANSCWEIHPVTEIQFE